MDAPIEQLNSDIGTTGVPNRDIIQDSIGAFGRYQLWLCFIVSISKFAIAWHQMAIIFLGPKVSYMCGDVPDQCPCDNPVYDATIFTRTIISEWNLICGDKTLGSFNQMLFQAGTLIGSIIFGMASDRYGRRPPFLVAVIVQVISGVGAAFVPLFWAFNLLRFLAGVSVGGTMVIGFVEIMEFIGLKHRPTVSALYQAPFNVGHLTLPLFSYYFRDYRYFQLSISTPVAILLAYFCILPETPRWLLAMKRHDEAIELLTRVAKINKLPTDNIKRNVLAHQASIDQQLLKKGTLLDLFKTPNLRKNILAMAYQWLSCSYCFYGVAQYISHLTGNIFVNVAASASVTLLGTLLSIPLIKMMRRKTMLIIFQATCGICFFVLAMIPEGLGSIICASIGVVAAFIVFILVYLYCSELFPTVVRSAAIGFSSMIARVGAMVAPFVIMLEDITPWLPAVVFGMVPALGVFITLLLPETKGCELMTTIEEGEAFGKKPRD